MSLATELTKAGTPPERLEVRCVVTMDEVEGKGHQVVHSAIEAHGTVPDCDEAASPRRPRRPTRAVRWRR